MGDNALAGLRARPACLREFHRAFNHQSTPRWGQPDEPCPILGLWLRDERVESPWERVRP